MRFTDTSVAFNAEINGAISFVSSTYTIVVDAGVAVDVGARTGGDDCPMNSLPDQWNFIWRGKVICKKVHVILM